MAGFNVLQSRRIYDGRVVHLRVDTVQLASGQITDWEIIEHSGAVAMVAMDSADNVYLVRQYRAAGDLFLLELPAGGLDPDEIREDCARRELQEEIGYYPEKLTKLGDFYVAASYTSEKITIYLAEELRSSTLKGDIDEDIIVEKMPFGEAVEMALSGQFIDSKTIIGITWAARYFGKIP